MAFEVARVHGIIRSNIREEDGICSKAAASSSSSMPGSFVLIQEQGEALVHVQKTQQQQTGVANRSCPPSGIRRDASSSAASWSDVMPCSSSLASSSHDSTEDTENDEEDDELLLAGLAQHVAQTMLNGAAAADDDEDSVLHSASGVDGKKTHNSLCTEANKAAESSPPSSWSSGSLLQWPQSATSSSTASSKGSSRMSSQVSSPPTTPVEAKRSDAWDLLHAAAGEVVRLKMHQQKKSIMSSSSSPTNRYHPKQVHHVQCQQQQPLQAHCFQVPPAAAAPQMLMLPGCRIVATNAPPPTTGILQAATILPHLRNTNERRAPIHGSSAYHQQGWNSAVARGEGHQHYSTHQQQQMAMETGGPGAVLGFQARSYPVFYHQQQSCRPVVLQKSYQGQCRSDRLVDNHTPQWTTTAAQRGGLGMRAVFLGSGNSQRKSSGTGVFLPRSVGNGAELKRKPVGS
ncbi:hypothetical protein CY35_07G094900 [Sphagnum magellanicum]|uniref:Uncharacterized protein n=1 Tax=Sphagnum magellanicum TaxID=128215 RepID=A0ACB8HN82_9BRYO|nr:hypothetical protein CY35_07G094900 [Sphagnum magellanicum]